MQVVPTILSVGNFRMINPWKFVDDTRQFWETIHAALWENIPRVMARHVNQSGPSASERALQQFNEVQWLLYRRHIERCGWRAKVSPARECWRFAQWTRRHSKNFRQLLSLYQIDWFKRYADLTAHLTNENERIAYQSPELEQLYREIESHLYQ